MAKEEEGPNRTPNDQKVQKWERKSCNTAHHSLFDPLPSFICFCFEVDRVGHNFGSIMASMLVALRVHSTSEVVRAES